MPRGRKPGSRLSCPCLCPTNDFASSHAPCSLAYLWSALEVSVKQVPSVFEEVAPIHCMEIGVTVCRDQLNFLFCVTAINLAHEYQRLYLCRFTCLG